MANKRGRKPKNNKSSVKIDNKLNEKLNNYSGLTGLTKTGIVNNLLNDFFKNKIVTNTYIKPPNLFYFNLKELMKDKTIKANDIEPIKELEHNYIIKAIPNNLDTFNKNYNSYCFNNNKNIHRGLLFWPKIIINNDEDLWLKEFIKDVKYFIFIFDYNNIKNNLNIGLIDLKDLDLYLNIENKEIIKNYAKEKKLFEKVLFKPFFDNEYKIQCFSLYMANDKILCPFSQFKKENDYINMNKKAFKELQFIINEIETETKANNKNNEFDIYKYDFTTAIFNNKYSLNNLI